MRNDREQGQAPVVLRPFRRLLRYGIAAVFALTVPLCAVALWLTLGSGRWWVVVVGEGGAVVLSLALILAFLRTGIEINDGGVRERGFFGRSILACSANVETILLVDLYQPNAAETLPNLFVMGAGNRLLIRMRGQYWAEPDMLRVAAALAVTITRQPTPMSVRELAVSSPQLLYWFERYSLVA
jgi:hypothetical protein